MIPANSVDHSRFPGMAWYASRTLYGPGEGGGAVPAHASFTLNTTTPEKSFCSARPLGCVSTAQCRSERSTALLLLAPEDN